MSSLSQAPEEMARSLDVPEPAVDAADEPGTVLAPQTPIPADQGPARPARRMPTARKWLVGAAIVAAIYCWGQTLSRPVSAGYADVTVAWLVGMACLALATAAWPAPAFRAWPARLKDWALAYRMEIATVAIIAVAALAARAIALGAYPFNFSGDEGSQAMSAVDVLRGRLTDPFSTGWFTVPTLFFFLQAWSIQLFGDSVNGVRMLSAIIGTLAVVATYVCTRHFLGRTAAVIAAALLAAFHFHVHFSRLASNQIEDSLLVVLALFFLDRALVEGRRLDAVLAGLVLGLAQYFYFGSRVLLAVAVAYVGYAFVTRWLPAARAAAIPSRALVARLPILAWIIGGALVAYAPLAGHYAQFPQELNSRIDQVSMFQSGWLTRAIANTGQSAPDLIAGQIAKAVFLPIQTQPSADWYRADSPFIGYPMAPLFVLGLALATLGLWQRRYFGFAIAYWICIVGIGLTEDPTQTQRAVITSPLMIVFIAVALVALGRIARNVLNAPRAVIEAVGAAIVVGLCVWNLEYYFLAPSQIDLYGGTNTAVATVLAYDLRAQGGSPTVYFFAPPRMFYYGFQNLPFIARDAKGIDVNQPVAASTPPLPLQGDTVFVFLPERQGELQTVETWYPNGTLKTFADEHGGLLFESYTVKGA